MGGGFRSTHQQRVLLSLERSMLPSCLYSGKWLAQRNHRVTGTFSKELLCLTKPFQGAAKANGLIFCKMNLTYLLNYIPDLFSHASEDKIGLWATSQVERCGRAYSFQQSSRPCLSSVEHLFLPYLLSLKLLLQTRSQFSPGENPATCIS